MATNKDILTDVQPIIIPGITTYSPDKKTITYSPQPDSAKLYFKYLERNDPTLYASTVAVLRARGITSKADIQKAFNAAVDWTQAPGTNNGNPWDYFNLVTGDDLNDPTQQPKYGTTKQVQETTTQYTDSSAAADANKVFKTELGREASAAEIAKYKAGVNAAAAKEPQKYEGYTTTSPGVKGASLGVSTTKATSTTGFDPTAFAQNFARSMPDYAESFAARTFLNLIDQSLVDPTRVGQVIE